MKSYLKLNKFDLSGKNYFILFMRIKNNILLTNFYIYLNFMIIMLYPMK